jgi:hypothetical protein
MLMIVNALTGTEKLVQMNAFTFLFGEIPLNVIKKMRSNTQLFNNLYR